MEYYISIDNEKQGPYSLQELEERGIQATTLVMPAGGTRWIPAWQIEELRRILEGNASTENQTGTEGVPFVEATPIAVCSIGNRRTAAAAAEERSYGMSAGHPDYAYRRRCGTDTYLPEARTAQGGSFERHYRHGERCRQ